MDRSKDLTQAINNYSPLTIQTGDVLGISIHSLNSDADIPFNGGGGGNISSAAGSVTGGSINSTQGGGGASYTVDQKGEIHLPQIPAIKVIGLTTSEAQLAVHNNLTNLLKEPVVNVRVVNFKISILGDVGHPGVFPVSGERINLLEALSSAGDLTITAKRNILLVREVDGERKFINIDMTSSNLFSSPYYYLKNNDIIYVDAGNAKFAAVSPFTRTLPIVLSFFSLAVGIVGLIVYTKR